MIVETATSETTGNIAAVAGVLYCEGSSEKSMTGTLFLHSTSANPADYEPTLDDHLLLLALQTGDEHAYELLIERFQTPVYNLAYRLLNDQSDAADVLQEVFIKIFRNVATFRGESSLRTWVYRIAVNESHNRRRWLFRHRRGETGLEETFEDSETREKPLKDKGETPYDFTMNREAQTLLEEGLAAINPVYKAVLVLREIEEMSYEEIAAILEVSIGTVKSRIVRGRDALRKHLASRLDHQTSMQAVSGHLVARAAK
jgi:RNA polymerase sigma-70 factor (ECF subfamily)